VTSLPNRFYHWIRHPSAGSVAAQERTVSGFEHLRGHKYCLLVTYKRSSEAVPTPVWFGLGGRALYVRSEANVAPSVAVGLPIGALLIQRLDAEVFRRLCMSFDAWIVGFGLSKVLVTLGLVLSPWAYLVWTLVVILDLALLTAFFGGRRLAPSLSPIQE